MNLILPIYSIFLLALLQIVFYCKKRINSSETNIYKCLMLLSTFNVVFNILGIYTGYNSGNLFFLKLLNHLDLPLYFWWASLLFLYLTSVDMKNNQKYLLVKKIVIGLGIAFTVITLFLPFEVIVSETEGYAVGLCVNFVYIISGIYITLSIIEAIKITKNGMIKKAIPVFMLLVLGIISAIIQKNFPNLIIIPAMIVFIELIMFFTIENPDLKILEEYNKNRELVEANIEDRTNILFKISEDVKVPIRTIKLLADNISKSDDKKEMYIDAKNIGMLSDEVSNMINDVLNISMFDKQKIKIFENTYDVYNLFNQIIYITKGKINSNINLKYSISNTIPEKLYGDSFKIKQIICSLITNAIKNTNVGTIDLDISSIVKYDVCRLIITIMDTGPGMSLVDINNILSSDEEISEKNLEEINDLDINLKLIKKIVDLLGGSLLIKSNEGKGTTFIIVLNQLIKENEVQNNISKVAKAISNKKRVLLVDDDYKELEKISNELKKSNFEVVSTMYGKDCVDRLANKEKYDLILLDDEMQLYNAVKIIEEIDKLDIGNTKIIVMLNKNKEKIKEHYVEDYSFIDYLLKSNITEEIKRIKEKYLL